MQWWYWVLLAVLAVAVLAGAVLAVQWRRRQGGVVVRDLGNEPRGGRR